MLCFDGTDDVTDRDVEAASDACDRGEARVALAALEPTHVRPIDAGRGGEPFLRHAAIGPESAHDRSERLGEGGIVHALGP